ncbi:MAG: DUF2071 domain-containing protein [Ornithinibacter sp.]
MKLVFSDIKGEIERRLLVNYRVDPAVVARVLPDPFRPLLVGEAAVAGICLIRLGRMRPRYAPVFGLRSENAAHRFAVEWDTDSGTRTGVYIPRRDSSSRINVLLGGRIYPGSHHLARFRVSETADDVRVAFTSNDRSASVDVAVRVAEDLEGSRLFADLGHASAFFEAGAVGYSPSRKGTFEGMGLKTEAWRVQPASVIHAHSSFFDDRTVFPTGSAELDCALLMRKVPVTWETLGTLKGTVDVMA